MVPEPVHNDPGREGIILPHNILGQLQTPAPILGISPPPEHFQKTSLYRIALLLVIAPIQKRLIPWFPVHYTGDPGRITDFRFQTAVFFQEDFQALRKPRHLAWQETPTDH